MATSSRIFVKGLPPNITEADFKKHFAFQGHQTTDVRLFSNRRIGYVGYRTSEDAQKAVKYFNKSFVRMSRIGVELARPPGEAKVLTSQRQEWDTRAHDVEQKSQSSPPGSAVKPENPKLKEFLDVMRPKSRKRAWENDDLTGQDPAQHTNSTDASAKVAEDPSDGEYEEIPRSEKRQRVEAVPADNNGEPPQPEGESNEAIAEDPHTTSATPDTTVALVPVSDEDWARSRTSRLLGLVDENGEESQPVRTQHRLMTDESEAEATDNGLLNDSRLVKPADPSNGALSESPQQVVTSQGGTGDVRSSMRLFIRNLPYDVKEEELDQEFAPFEHLEEVHIAMDKKAGTGKGFAYIQFSDPDSAERALREKDGQTFQGRLLHILPAAGKRESKISEFELSKLPLKKQQQIQRRREADSTKFNWNAMYMNPDAVVSSVATRLGISKSDILDPTSSEAAVKQAHAETHVIQETKAYFKSHGVDLDAFKRSQRGDTAILVKNIPYNFSRDELKRLIEEHGEIKRLLIPPNGVIAIVEMANAVQTKNTFGALAYRRVKGSMLFLEKAPKDLFTHAPIDSKHIANGDGVSKISTTEMKTSADADLTVLDAPGTATLFVRNLNFDTTTDQLTECFKPLSGFLSARVKTRVDPKRPGQILSMGFGFLEFRATSDAQAALQAMDGYSLDGHKLQIRASHKGTDAAEERRKADQAKREAGRRTKVIIKNLPFEATKKDVRALFGAYGQLRSVRVPKKMDRAARGFAFADFTTPKEAQSAMDALRDTHLLGRRLVLDFAADDPADAEEEIERMAAKVGGQMNAVAVQSLVGQGRKKFTTTRPEEDA